MSMTLLPTGFESLTPFIEFWAVDTAAARAHCRDVSDEAQRNAFYNAAMELIPQALTLLDSKPLNALNDSERRLMNLLLSFAHVSAAVELHREEEPKHAINRPFMRITRAPADQPPSNA